MSSASPTRWRFPDDGGVVTSFTINVAFLPMAPGGMWMVISSVPIVVDKLPPSSGLTGAVSVGIIVVVGTAVGGTTVETAPEPPPTTGR